MRALVQRVSRAEVRSRPTAATDAAEIETAADDPATDGAEMEVVGSIGPGLCVLVGVTHDDTAADADRLAVKVAGLRVFDDDGGVMNRSVLDVGGAVLAVSQFTLYGDTTRGRRPSWIAAARPEHAEPLVDRFCDELRRLGVEVATGRFRTEMEVELVNDGPVTLLVET